MMKLLLSEHCTPIAIAISAASSFFIIWVVLSKIMLLFLLAIVIQALAIYLAYASGFVRGRTL